MKKMLGLIIVFTVSSLAFGQEPLPATGDPRTENSKNEEAIGYASGAGKKAYEPQNTLHKLISRVDPIYPKESLLNGREGSVTVLIHVNALGEVVDVVVKESRHWRFTEAVITACRQWKFSPTLDGSGFTVQQTITFKLPPGWVRPRARDRLLGASIDRRAQAALKTMKARQMPGLRGAPMTKSLILDCLRSSSAVKHQ